MTKNKKRKAIIFSFLMISLIALIIWIAWGNTALELNTYTISSKKLPEAFSGYRIAHISDLHNAEMGNDNEKLLKMLKTAKPDIIAITGDFIDSRNTDIEISLQFAEEAMKIAPCYYVTGNHESYLSEFVYSEFEKRLIDTGVIVMHNKETILERDGTTISLIGIDDPDFFENYNNSTNQNMISDNISELSTIDSFTILLSHRPEFFNQYVNADINLILSGHAHGGQFRLPLVGGLVAPHQGFFPKYDAGLYTEENTNMIVSRGIGNSIIPFRFNNRPEVILIKLQNE